MSTALREFDELLAEVTVSVRPIMSMKVTDSKTEAEARSAGGQLATLQKRLDARVKELLAPLKAQEAAIRAGAKRIEQIIAEPKTHVGGQLDAWSAELTRKRNEELRIQREKEEAERKVAAEKRRKEEEELRLRQESKLKEREAAAKAEQDRINKELEEKRLVAEAEAAAKKRAADLFGASAAAKKKAEADLAEAKRVADEEGIVKRKAAEAQAAEERRVLEENQERERIADEARLQREETERQQALDAQRKEIEAQRVKGTRMEIVIDVVDAWLVPRELCRPPEVILADAKKAYKLGRKEIPGLTIREEAKVSLRSETLGGVA